MVRGEDEAIGGGANPLVPVWPTGRHWWPGHGGGDGDYEPLLLGLESLHLRISWVWLDMNSQWSSLKVEAQLVWLSG